MTTPKFKTALERELYEALEDSLALLKELQSSTLNYLRPDGYSKDEFINRVIYQIDGPEQRLIQGKIEKALSKFSKNLK